MKKVLFVITKSNWGGAQRYVYDLALGLSRTRFEVAVAYGEPGLLAERLEEAGVTRYALGGMQRDVSAHKDTRTFFELYQLFKRQLPDVVHLNSSKAGALGALAARLAGVPRIVFTVHGWPFLEQRGFLTRAALWLASWATVLLCHKVIVISDYDLRLGRRMPLARRKFVRIYNGIAPMPLASGQKIRSAFPLGAKIVGTIGELTRNKNQKALVEQAKADPTMHVAIVGGGKLYGELEALIAKYNLEDRVKLFGFMPASEALRGFDIFALPSLKEGLPYVLLEARAAGLPIEASRVGGIPEILDAKDMSEFSLERMIEKTSAVY
jgi:glycosyltransferase involved in cell wall biosynthesis